MAGTDVMDNGESPGSMSYIDAIVQDTQGYLVQSQAAAAQVQDNLLKQSAASQDIQKVYEQAVVDSESVARQKYLGELQVQQAITKSANAAGRNINATSDYLDDLITQKVESDTKLRSYAREYATAQNISFFDDGALAWLKSRFVTMPAIERDAKLASRVSEGLNTQITQTNQIISSTAASTHQLAESITAANIDSLARLQSVDAQVRSKQAAIEGWRYNSLSLEAAQTATKDRLSALYNVQSALKGEQQMQMAMDQFDQHLKEFEWRKEEKRIADDARKNQQELDGYVLDRINVGRAARGLPAFNGRDAKVQLQLLKAGGAGSKELEADYTRGELSLITGTTVLGSSPSMSAGTIVTQKTQLPEQRQAVAQLLVQAYNQAAANKMLQKPEEKAAEVDKLVNGTVAGQFASIKAGSDNLFDVGDLKAYAGMGAVQSTPVFQKVLAPAIQSGQPLNDPKVVLGLVNTAVYKGEITSTQAQDIATIYQTANEVNQAAKGFTGFGIQIPMNGKQYNANMGFGSGILNLTDSAAVGRYLAADLANRIRSHTPSGRGFGGPRSQDQVLKSK